MAEQRSHSYSTMLYVVIAFLSGLAIGHALGIKHEQDRNPIHRVEKIFNDL